MKKIILFIALFSFGFSKVTVAGASNITYVINELKNEFAKSHPNSQVVVNIGSSGKLEAQIEHSAPFDIFLSANVTYAQALVDKNISKSPAVVYAKGALILYTRNKIDLSKGIDAITSQNVSKIAIANPKTAPYGSATKEALVNAKLYDKVKNKLVFAQNISQTQIYAMRACDVGFIAKASLFSKALQGAKEGLDYIDVPSSLYKPIAQAMVLLSDKKEAIEFFKFLQSKRAKEIFKRYGYIE